MNTLNGETAFNPHGSTILVVDDAPISIQSIYNILSPEYAILAATSGEDALALCSETLPDLVLLDVMMPGIDGLEVCRRLKQDIRTHDIPILFLTAIVGQKDEDACWDAGAVDYITKPVNPTTLKNRLKVHLTIKYQRDFLMKLVFIDGLTGVYNRRYFDEHIKKLESASIRNQKDTALLLLDIDCFKRYNDHYGHLKGDEALRQVARIITSSILRPTDFACRYGGEEFVVVLPDTDLAGALEVAGRICSQCYNAKIEHAQSPFHYLTVSIGASTLIYANEHDLSVVALADKHLYNAKQQGKNCVFPHLSMLNPQFPKAVS
ncbi:diguanylate cyclase [Pseudoalteromonas fenneropenaei]|uniref:diguanylate cyclase n=1 Tax=Pseudoalteromonas fenneropenaei TaxID=1737459 RepID=A0ABV7CM37_9GAMM